MDDAVNTNRHDDYGRYNSTKVHGHGHKEAGGKGYTGGNEPTTNDGEHTGDAEHGTFATPGTVGQRGTHGYHKGDEGGGKGQLERGTEGNEQRGYNEVDRGTSMS